jgi:hypothetical protein
MGERKMLTKKLGSALAAAVSGLATVAAVAQSTGETEERPLRDTLFYVANGAPIMPFGGAVDIVAGEGTVMGEVVVDQPYSAESITESTQILGDGNRITRTNRARIYRDSAGRTRREQVLDSLGVWQPGSEPAQMITINDPVANESYFLEPNRQVARRFRPFSLNVQVVPSEARSADGQTGAPPGPNIVMRREWVQATPGVATTAGVAVGVQTGTEPTIQEFELALPPPGAIATAPVAMGTFSSYAAPPRDVTREDLGEQVLEGVLARGTRQTVTIEAGAIGNERPIAIVQEQWYSPELEAIVLRRNSDPRFGETTYRLVNVDRSEPPPELFTVPEDFTVAAPDEPIGGVMRGGAMLTPGVPGSPGQRVERGNRVFLIQPDASVAPRSDD